MKNPISLFICLLIAAVLLQQRIAYLPADNAKLKVTTYDALGYYMYLPAIALHGDAKELKWFPQIDSVYSVSGGWFYQANKIENGNYVFKYLGGVALLQTPFFIAGHLIAKATNYADDGFSPPYQYALAFGILLYCVLAIFLLRKILLLYFDDGSTAIVMLLLTLATNFVQYACVDNAMSHAYIFPLYVLQLWCTIKWHERPNKPYAFAIGLIIGVATICRPTEAVMLFIPLLWGMQDKAATKQKSAQVKTNKLHIWLAAAGGLAGVLPQLLYWRAVTGSYVYDVGSKWDFLNPHFRVLFGWEKGWFIYTPVTIFFMVGMFFIKRYSFARSVWWFCLLNIYIVIAWNDWRYGGSYSTRALVQSYPVFALPLTAFISRIKSNKISRGIMLIAGTYFIVVNLFQVWQYNKTILHYNDMNRAYYSSIYLDASPTPLDMSLLDSNVVIKERDYTKKLIYSLANSRLLQADAGQQAYIAQATANGANFLKIEVSIKNGAGFYDGYIYAEAANGQLWKERLNSPISKPGQLNEYALYIPVDGDERINLFARSASSFQGDLWNVKVYAFYKKS